MLEDEVYGNPRLREAMAIFGMGDGPETKKMQTVLAMDILPMAAYSSDPMTRDFATGVCKALVRHRNFGGKSRQIYTEIGELLNRTAEVYGRRVVKTGTYYGPSGGYDSYSGEYDYEPGGLTDRKTHVLLRTDGGEIEAVNVELVRAVSPR